MDAQQFLAEFGHFASALNGVVQLRALVLALAVSGRLTKSSDIGGVPADDLLRALQQEVSAYKAANKYRRSSVELERKSKLSARAPRGWVTTRLGEIGVLIRGVTYNKAVARTANGPGLIGLLRANNIGATVTFDDLVFVPVELVDKEQFLREGDVLIAMSSGSRDLVGKAAIVVADTDLGFGAFCGVYRPMPSVRREFIRIVMQSPGYREYVSKQSKGIGINNLTKGHIEDFEFFLPPIEEQSLIAAKVNELMALCGKLETQQQVRRDLQNDLRHSTLQALTTAHSPHELEISWIRLEANFDRLFSAPEDVRLLRDAMFDLALRGTLTSDTAELESTDSENEERPPLPIGWKWSTVAELSEYITSGSRGWKAYTADTGDAFIRSQDIKHDALIFESPAFVSLPAKVEGKRTLVQPGDVLLTITGGNVGKCATVGELDCDAYVSQHVALIRLRDKSLSKFVHFWMVNSFGGRGFLSRYIYGDKPGLNLTQVGSVPVPVPPKDLMDRVLGTLQAYRETCDLLAKQLKTSAEIASALAVSAVSLLTGIKIKNEEDETVKAPQTELISPLRIGTPPDVKAQAPLATLLARHNGEMSARDLWQRFGGEVDAFYSQLKAEVTHGWILEPTGAEMREKSSESTTA